MIDFKLKDDIDYDDDLVCLIKVDEKGKEVILFTDIFDSLKEYEMEDYTEEFEYGRELVDAMDWDKELNCFIYKEFRLYIFEVVVKR